MSTTAGSVAIELRRIADALDKEPDATVEPPMVTFYCNNYLLPDKGKAVFLKTIHLLPKPLSKRPNDNAMELEFRTASIWLGVSIDRSVVCEIVEPAKPAVYRCEPILSLEEENGLESSL
jgi:hypothetical protein